MERLDFIFSTQKHKQRHWSLESEKCHTKTLPLPSQTDFESTAHTVTEKAGHQARTQDAEGQVKLLHLPPIAQVVLKQLTVGDKHLDPGAPGGVR